MVSRKEMIKAIAEKSGETQIKVSKILDAYDTVIYDSLKDDGGIRAMDGITFEIKATKPRQARNPKTGDIIDIPEGKKISVRFGKTAKEFLKEF